MLFGAWWPVAYGQAQSCGNRCGSAELVPFSLEQFLPATFISFFLPEILAAFSLADCFVPGQYSKYRAPASHVSAWRVLV